MTTIILASVIFGFAAFVVIKQIKKAKSGESSCGCGCAGCSSASVCHSSGIKTDKK